MGGSTKIEDWNETTPWHSMQVLPNDTTFITLYGLTSGTLYDFMVQARMWTGEALYSESITVSTLGTCVMVK